MLNLVQTLTEEACGGLLPVFKFIRGGVFPVIQIGIPILLILMGSIDLGKAVLSSDDKEIKGATGKLIKRTVAAVAVFFVVTIVSVVFSWLGDASAKDADDTSWSTCWQAAGE